VLARGDHPAAAEVLALRHENAMLRRHAGCGRGRAIRYLARDEGICQFLDIGTGPPTADNAHEVAQRAAPSPRIVYAGMPVTPGGKPTLSRHQFRGAQEAQTGTRY
jgi:hypothetical protein